MPDFAEREKINVCLKGIGDIPRLYLTNTVSKTKRFWGLQCANSSHPFAVLNFQTCVEDITCDMTRGGESFLKSPFCCALLFSCLPSSRLKLTSSALTGGIRTGTHVGHALFFLLFTCRSHSLRLQKCGSL